MTDSGVDATSPPTAATSTAGTSAGTVEGTVEVVSQERVGQVPAQDRVGLVADRASEVLGRAGDAVEQAAVASGRIASAAIERLRNDAELVAERGSTRIGDEVVEKVAGIAAREVPEVHDLGGDASRLFASVKERVGLGEADEGNRGVSVRLDGDQATIGITLVVEYGAQVYTVAEAVRTKVIQAVEEMLSLKVTEVDIVVDDVHVPSAS